MDNRSRGSVKRFRRTGVAALAAVSLVLLTAGPALADRNPLGPREGADPGSGLSAAATIALYLLVPLAIMAAIASLVLLPGLVRGARYRPAMGWDVPPVWFAGPLDPVTAVADAQLGDIVRGGASGSW
jgi:hypothetical protein